MQEIHEYKVFAKPHFGPEDSPEKVIKMQENSSLKKQTILRSLREQLIDEAS